jgi:hypothetical protein
VPDFALLGGARGVDFDGGGGIRADSRGRIHVTDEQAAAIRGSSALRRYDAIIEVKPARATKTATRMHCRRGLWDWESICPRCGAFVEGASVK